MESANSYKIRNIYIGNHHCIKDVRYCIFSCQCLLKESLKCVILFFSALFATLGFRIKYNSTGKYHASHIYHHEYVFCARTAVYMYIIIVGL